MYNILVVGGAGYVGGIIVDLLKESKIIQNIPDVRITVYDKLLYEDSYRKDVNFVYGDIRDTEKLLPLLKQARSVIWLAALVGDGACQIDPALTKQVNSDTVKWLAENYDGRIIFTSTCHDSDTKLVTKRGLVRYNDIQKDDTVFSLNSNTLEIEESKIDNIIIKPYSGKMISFNGRRADILVTPDHNMWYMTQRKNLNITTAEELSSYSTFSLVKQNKFNPGKYNKINTAPFTTEDYFKFIGMFIGDGYLVYTRNKGISISGLNRKQYLTNAKSLKTGKFIKQKENKKLYNYPYNFIQFAIPEFDRARNQLLEILNKYKIKYTSDNIRISIRGRKDLNLLVKKCGRGAHNKQIPDSMLKYPANILEYLYEGLMLTDGAADGTYYTTVSNKLKDQFVELCLKIGKTPSTKTKYSISFLKGRKIEGTTNLILISNTNKFLTKKNIKQINYSGNVWCLTVPNHNFLIERNGKYSFTGNCSVYGAQNIELDETSPTNPLSAYAISKLEAEKYLEDKNALIFRLGTLFGVGDQFSRIRLDLVVNILTVKAHTLGKISVFGGDQFRPLLHVRDVAQTVVDNLYTPSTGIFNLHKQNVRIIDLAYQVRNHFPELIINHSEMPFQDTRNYRVSSEKAIKELNFNPICSIDQGIEELKYLVKTKRIKDLDNARYSNQAYLKSLNINQI